MRVFTRLLLVAGLAFGLMGARWAQAAVGAPRSAEYRFRAGRRSGMVRCGMLRQHGARDAPPGPLCSGACALYRRLAAAPVCSPTRASLMTGKSPARLHMTIWREAAEDPPATAAWCRRRSSPICRSRKPRSPSGSHAAGYLTALVGKWHLGDAAHYPEAHGFDVKSAARAGRAEHLLLSLCRTFGSFATCRTWIRQARRVSHRPADRRGDQDHRSCRRPAFFLYLAHHAVHTPMEAKPRT